MITSMYKGNMVFFKNRRRSMFQETLSRLMRNRMAIVGFIMLATIVILCLCAHLICPEGFDNQDIPNKLLRPGEKGFLLGTDNLGRSMVSRLLYGGRMSLLIGVVSTAIAAIIGIFLGAISGYYGGKIDNIIMRTLDVFSAIPSLLLAIAISAAMGTGVLNAMLAIGVATMPAFARMVRGPILSVKEQEYVEAARSIDASDARIIFKHVLPNVLSPIIIQITMNMAGAILAAASLSFLGLGVQAPVPEWGAMISDARQYVRQYPYLVALPGIAIGAVVLSMNLFGDGLRDALDPRLKD